MTRGDGHHDDPHQTHRGDLGHRELVDVPGPFGDVADDRVEEPADHEGMEDVAEVGEDADPHPAGDPPVEAVDREDPDEQRDDRQVEQKDDAIPARRRIRVVGDRRDHQRPEGRRGDQAEDVGCQEPTQVVAANLLDGPCVPTRLGRDLRRHDRDQALTCDPVHLWIQNRHADRLALSSAGRRWIIRRQAGRINHMHRQGHEMWPAALS